MRTKLLGGFFLLFSAIALLVFLADIWPGISSEALLVEAIIPALKYWAISELAGCLGIIFLSFAPDHQWTWQIFFSIEWWQADWFPRGFRILTIGAVLFLVLAVLADFVYKIMMASNPPIL